VNLDDSDGRGTHWVCFKKTENHVEYFDSYANMRPPLELQDYLKGCYLSWNRTEYQNINVDSRVCGHLCLAFLLD
jgi:hypothetical protein